MDLVSSGDFLESKWLEVSAIVYFCVAAFVSCVVVALKGRNRAWCVLCIFFPPALVHLIRRPAHPRAGQFQCPFCEQWNSVERELCVRCGQLLELSDFAE